MVVQSRVCRSGIWARRSPVFRRDKARGTCHSSLLPLKLLSGLLVVASTRSLRIYLDQPLR